MKKILLTIGAFLLFTELSASNAIEKRIQTIVTHWYENLISSYL